jgi:hypothetical protein
VWTATHILKAKQAPRQHEQDKIGMMSIDSHSHPESKAPRQCKQDGIGLMSLVSHSHPESKVDTKPM